MHPTFLSSARATEMDFKVISSARSSWASCVGSGGTLLCRMYVRVCVCVCVRVRVCVFGGGGEVRGRERDKGEKKSTANT